MTEYARLTVQLEHSAYSDYGSASVHSISDTESPTQAVIKARLIAATGGSTIRLDEWTTIQKLVIYNTDDTNFVTVAFDSASGSANVSLKVLAQDTLVLSDVEAGSSETIVITADTAACDVEYSIIGT
jgi:hypothetical protein